MERRFSYYMPEMEGLGVPEIETMLAPRLREQLQYCHESSAYYREKFRQAGAQVGDIRTFDDLRKLPVFMTKEDERACQEESRQKLGHTFGTHLCASPDEIYLTGTTSGTTGVPTFTYTFTKNDLDFLAPRLAHRLALCGVGKGDRGLFFFTLGIYATTMTLWGLRLLGALPIDIDARAGTDTFLKFADLTRPTFLACTPSLALYLIEKSPKVLGYPVSQFKLKGLLTTGEPGIANPAIKKTLEEAYNCPSFDYWSPAGHAPGISCQGSEYHGLHAIAPEVCTSYFDLIDPSSGESIPLADGAIGQMVHTSLHRQACPLVKYAYGDVVQISLGECPGCGFQGIRARLVGRADDMLIVKGVNVYPAAVRAVVMKFQPQVTGQMRIVLDAPPPSVVPPLKMKVEYQGNLDTRESDALAEKIAQAVHDSLRMRPKVIMVPQGSLPRSTRKTPVFEKAYE
ncbi:MAG: phenylacetate--CoA ligase family protein [Pseudomonadota bacterium]